MADGIILGHDNRYKDGTPVATDTNPDPDFNALNVNDLRKYTLWAGESAGQKYLYVDAGAAVAADILAIRGHNLGTAEAEVVVESSPGFSLSDAFDNGALDPVNFGTSLAGAGTAVETISLDVKGQPLAADAAIVYDKNLMGPRGLPWTLKNNSKVASSVASDALLMAYYQAAAAPLVAAEAAFLAKTFISVSQNSTGAIQFTYLDGSAVRWWWDGAAWQNTAQTAYAGVINTEYITRMDNNGNSIVIELWDLTETTMHASASVPWSSVAVEADDAYGLFGWPYTDKPGGSHISTLWEHTSFYHSVWTNRLPAFTPDSDGIIMRRFTSVVDRLWRTGFNTASIPAQLGILIVGQRLQLPYSADATVNLYDEGIDADTQDDDSGELLGTTVKQRNRRLEFTISNVERAFIFGELQSFWSSFSIDRRPFIIALYPDDFPEAVWFMRNAQSYRWQTPLRFFEWVENMRFNLRGPIEDDLPAGDVGP